MTSFRSENPEDPTWVTPGEMVKELGQRAQSHAGHGQGTKRITHSGCTQGREHSSRLAGALPLCTLLARSRHVKATSPLSQRHLVRDGEQSRGELLAITGYHKAKCYSNTNFKSIPHLCCSPTGLALLNRHGHKATAAGACIVPALPLTRIKVVDSHAILLASPDAEQLPMEVYGVDILSAAHVQEVPSDPLLLSHHQPGQCVTHIAIDG